MMYLRPFEKADFPKLSSWISDARDLAQFAGPEVDFPLREAGLPYFLLPDKKGYAYSWIEGPGQAMRGFGQILTPSGEIPRIGRLILDPALRGQGQGAAMMRQLMEKARALCPAGLLELYVRDCNSVARRCYEKLGFRYIPRENSRMQVGGEDWLVLKMRYSYSD